MGPSNDGYEGVLPRVSLLEYTLVETPGARQRPGGLNLALNYGDWLTNDQPLECLACRRFPLSYPARRSVLVARNDCSDLSLTKLRL